MDCDRDSGSSHVHDAINHLHDEDLEPEKSVKWGRRALLVILPACLLTAALVTFLIGLPAHPPDITLLDLQSDSELAKRNESLSCSKSSCAMLEAGIFAGVPGELWLMSINRERELVSSPQACYTTLCMGAAQQLPAKR
jgi:hypothetical protein